MCSFLRARPISLSMNNCSSTDSLRIFGRALFLAVVGLALQGGTNIGSFTVRAIQVGQMTRLGRSNGSVLGVLRFQC